MEHSLANLGRAFPVVRATQILVALLLLGQRRAAGRALGGHHPLRQAFGTQAEHRTDDLGDHVARLAQDHCVAGSHVLALDLVGVVQRGHLDGGPGHERRLHPAERGHPAGATGVDLDGEELGVDLLGWVLEGDRPPRRPTCRAEPALQRDLVDLDHNTVDVVRDDVVAVLTGVLDVPWTSASVASTWTFSDVGSPHAFRAAYAADWAVGSKPSRAPMPWQTMPRSRVAVTRGSFWRREPAAELRGFAKSGLPASARDWLSLSNASAVRNTSPRTSTRAGTGNSSLPVSRCGIDGDRLHVGRDVLAGAPVAAGQRPDQAALLVEQVDRQPVDLELAQQRRVTRRRRGRAGRATRRARRRRTRCPGSPSAGGGRRR